MRSRGRCIAQLAHLPQPSLTCTVNLPILVQEKARALAAEDMSMITVAHPMMRYIVEVGGRGVLDAELLAGCRGAGGGRPVEGRTTAACLPSQPANCVPSPPPFPPSLPPSRPPLLLSLPRSSSLPCLPPSLPRSLPRTTFHPHSSTFRPPLPPWPGAGDKVRRSGHAAPQ